DQASFFVATHGESARRSRPYTLNQYFAAIRVDEFKYIFTTEVDNGLFQKGNFGGFSGSVAVDTGGAGLGSFFTKPQEDESIGIRHIPMIIPTIGAAGDYMKELVKYPPQFKIGFLSNNPPAYDILPKLREMIVTSGIGKRPAPQ